MARGFESKDVEYQQAEAFRERGTSRAFSAAEHERDEKRQQLALALVNVRAERATATRPTHRQMLDQAIVALEEQIAGLSRA